MSLIDLFAARRSPIGAAVAPTGQAPAPVDSLGYVSPWSDPSHLQGIERTALDEKLSAFFGADQVGIDRAAAMTVPPIAKARHLMTGAASRIPLRQMTGPAPSPRPAAWIEQPEDGRPRSQTILWTIDQMIFHGRAFWLIIDRYETGYPRRFRWVPEWEATVDATGKLETAFGSPVGTGDWVRFDGPHEGLLTFAAPTIRDALNLARAAGNAAQNPVPSVDLHQTSGDPLTREEREDLLDTWRRARTAHGGGVAFTSKAIETRVYGQPPEQLLINARNAAAIDAARCLGIPAWAVDAAVEGSSLTYANTTARFRELLDFGLQPYLSGITDRLSMDDVLPHGVWAKFDPTDALRPSLKEQFEALKVGIDAGIITAEEAREQIEEFPLEDTTPQENTTNDENDADRGDDDGGHADDGTADRGDRGGDPDRADDHRQSGRL